MAENFPRDFQSEECFLFFPDDYKEVFLEIFGKAPAFNTKMVKPSLRSIVEKQFLVFKGAKIRKKSGKPGEIRWIPFDHVGSLTIVDKPTTQKRWHKTLIFFNSEGRKKGQPVAATIYIYLLPVIFQQLSSRCKKRNTSI